MENAMPEIIIEKSGKVATVLLNRPPVNALTLSLYQRLAETFEELGAQQDINCVILSANGTRAFCAGLDLHEFLAAKVEDDEARAAIVRRMFAAVRHCAVP